MPAACRVGDLLSTGHGCDTISTLITTPQSTVRINGILAAVIGAAVAPHTITNPNPPPACINHPNQILFTGSSTVRINGIPLGRVGDFVDLGNMIQGSINVFSN